MSVTSFQYLVWCDGRVARMLLEGVSRPSEGIIPEGGMEDRRFALHATGKLVLDREALFRAFTLPQQALLSKFKE